MKCQNHSINLLYILVLNIDVQPLHSSEPCNFDLSLFGLPAMSITCTVRVTIIVPCQGGRPGVRLALAKTIFVTLPVKVLHISHVQSSGTVVEVISKTFMANVSR